MRFKQFISERYEEEAEAQGPLADLIKEECAEFLSESKHQGFLYRGSTKPGNFEGNFSVPGLDDVISVNRRSVRKDRKPLSTKQEEHAEIDEWFYQNFGFKARSQSIFTFGEGGDNNTNGYGSLKYLVFPVGSFKYVWSPKIEDLWADSKTALRKSEIDLTTFLDDGEYTDQDLAQAVKSQSEVMIHCDEVLQVPYTALRVPAIKKALGVK